MYLIVMLKVKISMRAMLKMVIPIKLSSKIQVTVVDLTVTASAIDDRLVDVVMVVGDPYLAPTINKIDYAS